MAKGNLNPTTPNRNDSNLLSAWSRSRLPVLPPGLPPPRRVVNPAEAPPNTPTTTDRPRRLTVEPTLPRNIPTQPAAMRRAQEALQAHQQPLTPRRRVVPNILAHEPAEPKTPTRNKFKHKPPASSLASPLPPPPPPPPPSPTPPPPPPPPSPSPKHPQPYSYPTPISNPAATKEAIKAAALAASKRYPDGRYINANIYGTTSTGAPVITHTELIHYPKAQQQADYATLLSTSEPEETWESRRKAPMVSPARHWLLKPDQFPLVWYNAIVLSYKQDAQTGEELGGTLEEQEEEKRLKEAGHLAGVGFDLELRRYRFEAELLKRARDMVLRDNGVMPRNALGRPAGDGEPQAWCERLACIKMDAGAEKGGAVAGNRDASSMGRNGERASCERE